MKIAVIGGGASGLFVASQLKDYDVTIFDGNEKCGKKLFITGKGRCNVTNNCDKEEFLNNVVNGGKFMQSAISRFLPTDTIAYFEEKGLKLKTERGGRVFPVSDKSSDVIKTLERACKGATIKLNEKVTSVSVNAISNYSATVIPTEVEGSISSQTSSMCYAKLVNSSTTCHPEQSGYFITCHPEQSVAESKDLGKAAYLITTTKDKYTFDKVIIATGGNTYSGTGSEGDGYKFAKMLGHSIVEARPALVPIKLKESVKAMQGLPLKNVTLYAVADNKRYSQFGEMMFTDEGITGPIVLTMSSYINRAKKVELYLDLKPALSHEQLDGRLLREFDEGKNKNLFNVMRSLMPKNFIDYFLYKVSLNSQRKINSITQEERERLVKGLKNFPLAYKELYPLDSGIITSGGVNLKEINPSTMESKKNKGLHFVGEVLDVDCLTGGFNLQTAFSTAYACGQAIKKEEKNGI